MRLASLIFILLVPTWALQAAGAPIKLTDCESRLEAPDPITRDVRPAHAIELERAGRVYTPGESLKDIADDVYVFILTSHQEILLAPKYQGELYLKSGKGLATHPALLAEYQRLYGRSIENDVVAAGEIIVSFGRVTLINNRSGNYRAGEASLKFAVSTFQGAGLRFTPGVEILGFDPNNPRLFGHTPKDRKLDEYQLDVLGQVLRDPQMSVALDLYRRFAQVMRRVFADSDSANLDWQTPLIMYAVRSGKTNGLGAFSYVYASAGSIDGLHEGIFRNSNQYQAHRLALGDRYDFAGLTQIDNALEALKPQLSPQDLSELKSLCEGFRRLTEQSRSN